MRHKKLLLFLLVFLSANIFAQDNDKSHTESSKSWFGTVEQWYSENMNYSNITILMAAESSIFPVPSELVVPPAAYIASKEDGHLSMFWVVFFATVGALIGATVNYLVLGLWLGRTVIYRFADSRWGRMLFMSSEKLQKAELFFNKYGKISTFIGRFIPVVRHFISIPAGFAKMNFVAFAIYTFIGAGLWNCILALMGYFAHGQQDMINRYAHEIGYVLLGVVLVCLFLFVFRYCMKRKKYI